MVSFQAEQRATGGGRVACGQTLVVCGFTHGGDEIQVAANLWVVTGPAECGRPEIQPVLQVG